MIDIDIRKCLSAGVKCDNPNCKKLPELFDRVLNTFYLKEGVTYAAIYLGGKVDYYCRDCIDEVYNFIKSKMDSKLWIFK